MPFTVTHKRQQPNIRWLFIFVSGAFFAGRALATSTVRLHIPRIVVLAFKVKFFMYQPLADNVKTSNVHCTFSDRRINNSSCVYAPITIHVASSCSRPVQPGHCVPLALCSWWRWRSRHIP